MDTPTVTTGDPGIAYTADALWTVTHNGGPHCAKRVPTNYGPMHTVGCPLPLDHDGECIPTSDELLSAGVQLWPCVTL